MSRWSTGTDEDDPDTAADKAKEVADLIHSALTRTDGLRSAVETVAFSKLSTTAND